MEVLPFWFRWIIIWECSNGAVYACHYGGHGDATTTALSGSSLDGINQGLIGGLLSSSLISGVSFTGDVDDTATAPKISDDSSIGEYQRTSILNFFPQCMRNLAPEEDTDFDDLVKFIIDYTSWFSASDSSTGCAQGSDSDTVQCWKSRLEDLLVENSKVLYAARWCVDDYRYLDRDISRQPEYEISLTITEEIRSNDENCPGRTKTNYNTCVNNYFSDQGQNNPFLNFTSVLEFLDKKVKCSDCDCENALIQDSSYKKHYEKKKLKCDSCWSSRAAAIVRAGSKFGNPMKACTNTLTDKQIPGNIS